MAFKQLFPSVVFEKKEDFSGALLRLKDTSSSTCASLKRWLATTGRLMTSFMNSRSLWREPLSHVLPTTVSAFLSMACHRKLRRAG